MTPFGKAILGIAVIGALSIATGLPAQAQSLDEIRERGSINIGMLVDYPPFGLVDEQGNPAGYDADVAAVIAEDLGVELNIVPTSGANRIPYLVSGQVDLLVASLGVTPERAERVAFTQPYAGIETAIFGEVGVDIPDAEDMAGKVIGVARSSTQDTLITSMAPEGTDIRRFNSSSALVQALLSGQVQAIGVSSPTIAEIQKRAPGKFETKFGLSEQYQAIAVRKDSEDLVAYLNDLLTRVKQDGTLNEINQTWFAAPLPEFVAQSDESTTAAQADPNQS